MPRNVCEGADRFMGGIIGLALGAPGYSVRDINDWTDGQILPKVTSNPSPLRASPLAVENQAR